MNIGDKTLHVCDCNGTMPLDGAALAKALALAGPLPIHTQLCQKELASFVAGAASGPWQRPVGRQADDTTCFTSAM